MAEPYRPRLDQKTVKLHAASHVLHGMPKNGKLATEEKKKKPFLFSNEVQFAPIGAALRNRRERLEHQYPFQHRLPTIHASQVDAARPCASNTLPTGNIFLANPVLIDHHGDFCI